MTRAQSADERIRILIHELTPDQLPDRVLQATFEQTRSARQRRGRTGWRLFDMFRAKFPVIAAGAAAITLLAVGAVVLWPRLNPSVGVSGPGSQIAFTRLVDGNTDIYMMNLDGTGLVRLTDDPLADVQPAWSPDGQTLYFVRRPPGSNEVSDIHALDVETGNVRQVTNEPGIEGEPNVSPDGSRIAFEVWPNEAGTYVMDVDGSNRRQVFATPDDTYVLVGWTADGEGIYLIRNGNEILRVEVATGAVSPVANGGHEELSLSPDGSTFAYWDENPPGMLLMNTDGSNVREIAGTDGKSGPPAWSPDGSRIAFGFTDGWIYLVPVEGDGMTQLTEGDSPAWRPVP